jgi:16S rRNA (guanine527-N7)-methyltransferase
MESPLKGKNQESFDDKAFANSLRTSIEEVFKDSGLPAGRVEKLVRYGVHLAGTSASINLTRILEPRDMAVRHFLDSFQLIKVLKQVTGPVLDAGTGGGVPGIPLAIFRRDLRVVMIDGTEKKIRYVRQWIEELKLKNASAYHARVEEHLKDRGYHTLISRAAIKPALLFQLLETIGPAVKRVVFMEGKNATENVRKVMGQARAAGYFFDLAYPYDLPGLDNPRYLVCFNKI